MSMGTLFRGELKKIFARKLIGLSFLLVAALILIQQAGPIKDTLSGYVRGMREVYGRYEGRTINEAFQNEAREDYAEFALSHSEHFNTGYDENQNAISYSAKDDGGYYGGVERAYEALFIGESVEKLQRENERLASRRMPLNAYITPTVRYLGGWDALGRTMGDGYFALFLLVLGLLPLFTQETAARMEGVLLCSKKRGRAAISKALAAALFAFIVAMLIYGAETLAIALTYGLNGANAPLAALRGWLADGTLTVGGYYTLAALATTAAVMASAALMALASSLFRQPLAVLGLAGALITAQFLPGLLAGGSHLHIFMSLMPAPALTSPWEWMGSLTNTKYSIFSLAFPALLSVLILITAPRCFLRRRKA
jgi:hypothetical protein